MSVFRVDDCLRKLISGVLSSPRYQFTGAADAATSPSFTCLPSDLSPRENPFESWERFFCASFLPLFILRSLCFPWRNYFHSFVPAAFVAAVFSPHHSGNEISRWPFFGEKHKRVPRRATSAFLSSPRCMHAYARAPAVYVNVLHKPPQQVNSSEARKSPLQLRRPISQADASRLWKISRFRGFNECAPKGANFYRRRVLRFFRIFRKQTSGFLSFWYCTDERSRWISLVTFDLLYNL